MWINEKIIEEGLDHKHFRETTLKYLLNNRKHTHELVDKPKNNPTELS